MKFEELIDKGKVKEINGRFLCVECDKEYSKKGISIHHFYNHTEDGKIKKDKISTKLEGKTKKELTKKKNLEIKKIEAEEKKIIPIKKNLNRDEIKKFLDDKYGNNDLSNVGRWIKKKYQHIYSSIVFNTHYLKNDCGFSERLYHILYDIYSVVLCKKCNNPVSFKSLYFGYYTYCSTKCMANDSDIRKKKEETCLDKYGVTHQSKTDQFKEKVVQTNMNTFGVAYPAQSDKIKENTKRLFASKYGVDNPMKVPEFKENLKDVFVNKFGVDNPSKLDSIKEKKQETSNRNFGANHFMQVDSEPKKRIIELQRRKFDIILNRLLEKMNLQICHEEYQHAHYKHLFKCTQCGTEFYQIWNMIQQGFLCPTCYPRNNGTSLQEKELVEFIKKLLPNEQIIENSRQIIPPKELDLYIPSMRIAFEYHGLYWHSEEYLHDYKYHLNKLKECEKQNIRLIQIFEDEWLLQQKIVTERVKNILNINHRVRIHARQCQIKEIDAKIKNKFLEKFHIQGKDRAGVKLGAFFNDELISVMTFSHGNIAKGSKTIEGIWELNRFCSDSRFHIPGIASKLLSYFKKEFPWKEIFSYADMRWSDGNLYKQLGFDLVGETGPNYWYVKDFQRIHRFNLRKTKDDPKEISEWIIRQNEGYLRIWDCGSLKFSMDLKS